MCRFNVSFNINKNFETFLNLKKSNDVSQAINLLGKYVTIADVSTKLPVSGTVSGVNLVNDEPELVVGDGKYKLTDILSIEI